MSASPAGDFYDPDDYDPDKFYLARETKGEPMAVRVGPEEQDLIARIRECPAFPYEKNSDVLIDALRHLLHRRTEMMADPITMERLHGRMEEAINRKRVSQLAEEMVAYEMGVNEILTKFPTASAGYREEIIQTARNLLKKPQYLTDQQRSNLERIV